MRRGYCHGCSYCKLIPESDFVYCEDKDCKVDPYEPDCNYD